MCPSTESSLNSLQKLSSCAFMAALIAVGALFHVSIGPVPITFQDFFIVLTGIILGPRLAMYSVCLYLFAGAIGFPVFSGGRGGIGHLFGPTGGYLVGFIFLAFFTGLAAKYALSKKTGISVKTYGKKTSFSIKEITSFFLITLVGAIFGLCTVYFLGTVWLASRLDISLQMAFTIGVLPFLPFGLPKTVLAVLMGYRFTKRKKSLFSSALQKK